MILLDNWLWRFRPVERIGTTSFHRICATCSSYNDYYWYIRLRVRRMLIIVQTVISNFTAYTMQRVHRQKHQVYVQTGFEIRSLNSLVREAKQETAERLDLKQDNAADETPLKLPFHDVTEHIMESVQQWHHQLQSLLVAHLGSDARHVIAAERARQASVLQKQGEEWAKREGGSDVEAQPKRSEDAYVIAPHLSEVGQTHGADELVLLNEYRKRYASILAQLLVAKDKLVEYEEGLVQSQPENETLRHRIEEELEELCENLDFIPRDNWRKRRSSEW